MASDMNYFYNIVVPEDERSRVESLEPFDEYEEWHLKCAHYVLLTAFSGNCLRLASLVWPAVSLHSTEISDDILNAESLRGMSDDCGTFVTASKQSSTSSNAELLGSPRGCGVKEPASSDGTQSISSEIEPDQLILQEAKYHLPPMCKHGSHWKAAKLTYIGEEPDLRCQRFGHTASVVSVNGRHHMVAVGGFGVTSSGRHRRLSDINAWDLSTMTPETYSVSSDGLLSRMCHATVALGNSAPGNPAVGNSRLLVVGGRHSPTSPVRDHIVLVDFSDTTSTSVACHTVASTGDTPQLCWRHSVVHSVIDSKLIAFNS